MATVEELRLLRQSQRNLPDFCFQEGIATQMKPHFKRKLMGPSWGTEDHKDLETLREESRRKHAEIIEWEKQKAIEDAKRLREEYADFCKTIRRT